MPSALGGNVPRGPGGGGNYPAFPMMPGSGQVNPNNLGYNPTTGEPIAVPGAPGTPPVAPNLTEIQANPQLQQVFQTMFGKVGEADPFLMKNIANIEGRMSADTTGRAINRAQGKIQDASAGALQGNKERAARMGGGGGEAAGAAKIVGDAQRLQAGAAADISLGRERDLDQLALGAGSAYAAPGARELGWANAAGSAANASASNQLGAAGQALQAWQTQQQVAMQQQQMAQAQQMAMLQAYQSLWN